MKEEIRKREEKCFDFLKAIPINRRYVLVGGYAVSSFHFPRLSVDLDIAIPEEELKFFEDLLKKQDFVLTDKKSNFDRTYRGRFEKYRKNGKLPVSVDLLIGSIHARQTNYAYSFDYVFRNSVTREIRGWHPRIRVKARVADKEMLIGLKINSMRSADKRDIIMLCYEKPDADKIIKHLKDCPKETILQHIKELKNILIDPKHSDGIKGVFTISDPVLKRAKTNCLNVLENIS
ncbi:MAG: hypothetical protein ACE5HY_03280 [Candidatus Hydrothermarchaeales archaeon]